MILQASSVGKIHFSRGKLKHPPAFKIKVRDEDGKGNLQPASQSVFFHWFDEK